MFQELLQKHLARGVLSRGLLSIDSGAIALASDLGLKRAENQDRTAVMKFRSPTAFYTLIAVVDGMGGMRDGEKAAELAISTFFSSVLETVHLGSEYAVTQATLRANDAVFAFTNGKGGSTLSAVLLCSDDENITVNVGDSRIYAKDSVLNKVIRLSVDDSLAEAVGGSGTELIQYIGMGEGIRPHVFSLASEISQVYLTTDGVHYIEPQTLSDIIKHAGKVTQVVERLIATARWCGGPDNASICAVDLDLLNFEEHVDDITVVQVSDPFTSMQFIWGNSPVEQQTISKSQIHNTPMNCEQSLVENSEANDKDVLDSEHVQIEDASKDKKKADFKKSSNKKSRPSKKKIDAENDIQIDMIICDSDNDENSKNAEVQDDTSK